MRKRGKHMRAVKPVQGQSSLDGDDTSCVRLTGGAIWLRGSSSVVEQRKCLRSRGRSVQILPAPCTAVAQR